MAKQIQDTLFDVEEHDKWKEEWIGMPEFAQEDLTSFQAIIVHFATEEDRKDFEKLIGQKLTYKTRSIWFPKAEIGRYANKVYIQETQQNLFNAAEISNLCNIEGSMGEPQNEPSARTNESALFDSN